MEGFALFGARINLPMRHLRRARNALIDVISYNIYRRSDYDNIKIRSENGKELGSALEK